MPYGCGKKDRLLMIGELVLRRASVFAIWSVLLGVSSPVLAEEWSVLVIGNPSAAAPSAFADSFHIADTLASAGLRGVDLHRDQTGDDLAGLLDTRLGSANVLIYYAGDLQQNSAGTALIGTDGDAARAGLTPYMQRLANSGTQRVALLIEDCFAGAKTGDVTLPQTFGMDVFVASTGDCTQPRLTDLIVERTGETTLQDILATVTITANDVPDIALAAPRTPQVIASADNGIDVVDRTRQDVISIIPMATTRVASTAQPVGFAQTIAPSVGQTGPGTSIILPAPPVAQQAALTQQNGFPEPSIIVGIIAGQDGFDRVNPDLPQIGTSEIAYDDVDARRGLRDQDPELFVTLVAGGAFDPPTADMARALQTELSRMNCYRARIDGDWGNQSRGAVDRYFAQAGGSPTSREAVADLFRQVILTDDVRCPTPVVAQPRPAASPSPSNNNVRTPQTQPTAPTPAPAPAAPSGGGLGDVNLGGVFRG